MSEENNLAEDFLLKIDQESKERAAAEQSLQENRKQRAHSMFEEVAQVIDEYLNALGKRHFGTGSYEIKTYFRTIFYRILDRLFGGEEGLEYRNAIFRRE